MGQAARPNGRAGPSGVPLEHHYLLTETIPEVARAETEMPMVVDLEGYTYMRQDQKGMLVGIYETKPQHWSMDGAPWDYGVELLQENIDRISGELELVFQRYPCCRGRASANGSTAPSPSLPTATRWSARCAGKPGYWLACGVMAGFLQGGGVGKALAEWIIRGETTEDVYGLDIARYGAHTSNREYIKQTTGEFYARRFVMTYPNEQLPAGRPLKTTPTYDAMTAAGCQLGKLLGPRGSPLFRAPRLQGKADAQALERLRHCRRGVPDGARGGGPARYRVVLAIRGDRTERRSPG